MLVTLAPALPPAVAVPMSPFANNCFPEVINPLANWFVPVSPDGFGTWTVPINYGTFQGGVVCQAANLGPAGVAFSTPLVLELLP